MFLRDETEQSKSDKLSNSEFAPLKNNAALAFLMVTLICSGWQCRLLWIHPSAIDLKEIRRRRGEGVRGWRHWAIGENPQCAILNLNQWEKWRPYLLSDHPHCTSSATVSHSGLCFDLFWTPAHDVWLAIVPRYVSHLSVATVFHATSKAVFFISCRPLINLFLCMLVYFNLEWEISDSPWLLRKIKL